MSRHHSVLAAASRAAIVLLVASGLGACASSPPPAESLGYKCRGDKHQVTVSEKSGMPEVVPDSVNAREGDEVHWIFRGAKAREFAILFKSVRDSPFDWSGQKGAQVKACVNAGAAKDGRATEYKYSVEIDGQVLDPKIIIEK